MHLFCAQWIIRFNLSADSEVSDDFFQCTARTYDLTVWMPTLGRVFGVGPNFLCHILDNKHNGLIEIN